MDKFYYSVRLDGSLCRDYINYIKRCSTGVIRVQGDKASISNKFCIDCDECIRVCPHHVKLAAYDKLDVVKEYRHTVVLSAPSLYSQFNNLDDVSIVLNTLLLMGFNNMSEANAAAELISETTRQYISEHEEQLPPINTAYPSAIRLIRVRFPNLISHLLSINLPMGVAAVLTVKKAMEGTGLLREEIGVMFTSSCLSKMTYVKPPLETKKSEIDQVLAIRDMYPKLLACMKTVVGEDYPAIGTSGKTGTSWEHGGGEASGLLTENYLAADGIEDVIHALEDMESQRFTNLRFVKLDACNGGCVGGVLTVGNPCMAEIKLKHPRRYMPMAKSHMYESEESTIKWTTGVQYGPVPRLGNNMMKSFSRLNQVGRLMKKFPSLDYDSCGASTCKALVGDTVRGDANGTNCVYYLRENLHKLSRKVAVLADNLHNGDRGGQEILRIPREYIQRISDEMSVLDKKDEDED